MLESVVEWEQSLEGQATRRGEIWTLSPGFQTGWNVGDTQTIVGAAVPVAVSNGDATVGVFGYLSYELPFTRM